MQTEREVRTMKAKSLGHLSTKAINKLSGGGIYDTKKYRYIVNRRDGEIYRIEKDLLGTTEALEPENWIRQFSSSLVNLGFLIFVTYSFFNVLFGFHDILSNHPFPVVPFLFCIIAYFLYFVKRFSKKSFIGLCLECHAVGAVRRAKSMT